MYSIISSSRYSRPDTRRYGKDRDNLKFESKFIFASPSEQLSIAISCATAACIVALTVAVVVIALVSISRPAFAASPDDTGSPVVSAKPTPTRFGLFGSLEFRAGRLDAIRQWHAVRGRIDGERAAYERCDAGEPSCPKALRAWRAELKKLDGSPRIDQLRSINRFVNRAITYRSDANRFARADHWASPSEVLTRSGDCEDYAIAKFVSLIDMGFSNRQLRIAVVRDTLRRIDHAVVTVALDGRTYVLDSLFDEPVPHEYVLQYDPVFSVNLDTRWAHVVTRQIRSAFVTQILERKAADEHERTEPVAVVELSR